MKETIEHLNDIERKFRKLTEFCRSLVTFSNFLPVYKVHNNNL